MIANPRKQESNGQRTERPKHNRDAIRFWCQSSEQQYHIIQYHNEVYHDIESSPAVAIPADADGVAI